MNKFRSILALTLILLTLTSAVSFAACSTEEPSGEAIEPLVTTLLKVGKADAIVILQNETCMVIDTGEDDDGAELCRFLANNGVTRVGTLIITHFDKDHVGGADMLIENYPVDRVLVPDYDGSSAEYSDFVSAMDNAGIAPERLREQIEFDFGNAKVTVEPPKQYPDASSGKEIDNNCSLITTIVHGQNRLLFMGDAEKKLIKSWLTGRNAQKCSFIKMPHHGVYNAALSDLLAVTKPEYAAICSSDKNPAESATLELLKKAGASTFETRNGNITVTSDGVKLEIKQNGR